MIQKLKSVLLTVGAIAVALLPAVALSGRAFAVETPNISSGVCQGTDLNITDTPPTTGGCTQGVDTGGFQGILNRAINIFSIVVGVIAVIMIIVGGLRYITSGGESNKVGSAKTTIIYALVGLVVVAVAQLLVHFVLGQANNLTTTSDTTQGGQGGN